MSDDTIRIPADQEAPEASVNLDASNASQPNGETTADTAGASPASRTTGAPRRRRRGSRGGRNRRKKPSAVTDNGGATAPASDTEPDTDVDDVDDVDEII